MKREPKIRKDGLCHTCKKERTERAIKEGDPFCSTECCRVYQGILPRTKASDGRRMPSKAQAAKANAARKAKNPGSNFEIRGKRSDRVER